MRPLRAGLVNLLPGGSGVPPAGHYEPAARSSLDGTANAGSRKRGPEAEKCRDGALGGAAPFAKGCARFAKRAAGRSQGSAKRGLANPWRLPPLHSLTGRKKGKRRSRRRSNNTGGEACALADDECDALFSVRA